MTSLAELFGKGLDENFLQFSKNNCKVFRCNFKVLYNNFKVFGYNFKVFGNNFKVLRYNFKVFQNNFKVSGYNFKVFHNNFNVYRCNFKVKKLKWVEYGEILQTLCRCEAENRLLTILDNRYVTK